MPAEPFSLESLRGRVVEDIELDSKVGKNYGIKIYLSGNMALDIYVEWDEDDLSFLDHSVIQRIPVQRSNQEDASWEG